MNKKNSKLSVGGLRPEDLDFIDEDLKKRNYRIAVRILLSDDSMLSPELKDFIKKTGLASGRITIKEFIQMVVEEVKGTMLRMEIVTDKIKLANLLIHNSFVLLKANIFISEVFDYANLDSKELDELFSLHDQFEAYRIPSLKERPTGRAAEVAHSLCEKAMIQYTIHYVPDSEEDAKRFSGILDEMLKRTTPYPTRKLKNIFGKK